MAQAAASAPLQDEDVDQALAELPDDAARKRWLMEAYGHGRISEEQVALAFYRYDLRDA